MIRIVSSIKDHYVHYDNNICSTGVEFSLSEDDFRQNEEPNATMEIQIAKDGILATPVLFRVTPLTVLEAERLNITQFARPAGDDVSPSIAGTEQVVHFSFKFFCFVF